MKIVKYLIILFFLLSCQTKSGRLQEDEPAPLFTANNPYDQSIALNQFKGKFILVHFWADWCSDCRAEFEKLERAYQQLKPENFEILAVNVGQSKEHVLEFIEHYNLTFPMLMDEVKEVAELYKIRGLPTNYFIRPDLSISKITIGWVTEKQISDQINKMRSNTQ